jgi:hypothetical protein
VGGVRPGEWRGGSSGEPARPVPPPSSRRAAAAREAAPGEGSDGRSRGREKRAAEGEGERRASQRERERERESGVGERSLGVGGERKHINCKKRMRLREPLDTLQCRFFPHFGEGERDRGTVGDSWEPGRFGRFSVESVRPGT